MKIPLKKQVELYERTAHDGFIEVCQYVVANHDKLIALGRERAFEGVGISTYHDSSYFLSIEQLYDELSQELADAVYYASIIISHLTGLTKFAESEIVSDYEN